MHSSTFTSRFSRCLELMDAIAAAVTRAMCPTWAAFTASLDCIFASTPGRPCSCKTPKKPLPGLPCDNPLSSDSHDGHGPPHRTPTQKVVTALLGGDGTSDAATLPHGGGIGAATPVRGTETSGDTGGLTRVATEVRGQTSSPGDLKAGTGFSERAPTAGQIRSSTPQSTEGGEGQLERDGKALVRAGSPPVSGGSGEIGVTALRVDGRVGVGDWATYMDHPPSRASSPNGSEAGGGVALPEGGEARGVGGERTAAGRDGLGELAQEGIQGGLALWTSQGCKPEQKEGGSGEGREAVQGVGQEVRGSTPAQTTGGIDSEVVSFFGGRTGGAAEGGALGKTVSGSHPAEGEVGEMVGSAEGVVRRSGDRKPRKSVSFEDEVQHGGTRLGHHEEEGNEVENGIEPPSTSNTAGPGSQRNFAGPVPAKTHGAGQESAGKALGAGADDSWKGRGEIGKAQGEETETVDGSGAGEEEGSGPQGSGKPRQNTMLLVFLDGTSEDQFRHIWNTRHAKVQNALPSSPPPVLNPGPWGAVQHASRWLISCRRRTCDPLTSLQMYMCSTWKVSWIDLQAQSSFCFSLRSAWHRVQDMNCIVLWPVWAPRTMKCNDNNNENNPRFY
jgi:hypothetical protein